MVTCLRSPLLIDTGRVTSLQGYRRDNSSQRGRRTPLVPDPHHVPFPETEDPTPTKHTKVYVVGKLGVVTTTIMKEKYLLLSLLNSLNYEIGFNVRFTDSTLNLGVERS